MDTARLKKRLEARKARKMTAAQYDEDKGRQRNMKCTCGVVLPVNSRSSICKGCLSFGNGEDGDYGDYDY